MSEIEQETGFSFSASKNVLYDSKKINIFIVNDGKSWGEASGGDTIELIAADIQFVENGADTLTHELTHIIQQRNSVGALVGRTI